MSILNIKTKITLWYTIFMIVIVIGFLSLVAEFTGITLLSNQKEKLIEEVYEAASDIEKDKKIDYFDDGIYFLVYNEHKEYLKGNIPYGFMEKVPLIDGNIQEIKEKNNIFYIYDKYILTENSEKYWVRGIISNNELVSFSHLIIKISFIILPVLVIISSCIGYFITKKAFLPVKKIQETAENITKENKLSLRIDLVEGKDEISKLGKTIDEMLEKLEKSFQREKQFTSDASHELRTPISVILAESEYILKHGDSIEEAKESMEIINRQATKISSLINQLLFFTRAEHGELKLKLEAVDIVENIKNIIEDFKMTASSKGIKISLINQLKERYFNVDVIMFDRAIQNLIQNAISYGKDNGKIDIKVFEKKDFFVLSVKDNGIGIEKKNLEKIWNRFFQVEDSRTKQEGSMGLGLSMVKLIVESHEGYVEVESSYGIGTEFKLYFKKL